jgi:hypothetical protein
MELGKCYDQLDMHPFLPHSSVPQVVTPSESYKTAHTVMQATYEDRSEYLAYLTYYGLWLAIL